MPFKTPARVLICTTLICLISAKTNGQPNSQDGAIEGDDDLRFLLKTSRFGGLLRSGGIEDPQELNAERDVASYMTPRLDWPLEVLKDIIRQSDQLTRRLKEAFAAKMVSMETPQLLSDNAQLDATCLADWEEYELRLVGFLCNIIEFDLCKSVPGYDAASWFVKMFDSSFKPPNGILEGATHWMGSGQECAETRARVSRRRLSNGIVETKEHTFNGMYCTARIAPGNVTLGNMSFANLTRLALQVGQCVPDTCRHNPMLITKGKVTSALISLTGIKVEDIYCGRGDLEFSRDWRAILAAVIIATFSCLCVMGTIYDTVILTPSKKIPVRVAKKTASAANLSLQSSSYSNKGFIPDAEDERGLEKGINSIKHAQNLQRCMAVDETPMNVFMTGNSALTGNAIRQGGENGVKKVGKGSARQQSDDYSMDDYGFLKNQVSFDLPDVMEEDVSTIPEMLPDVTPFSIFEGCQDESFRAHWKKLRFFEKQLSEHEDKARNSMIGLCGKLLLSFSLYRNVPRIVKNRDSGDKVKLLNALRFLSFSWLCFANTYKLGITNTVVTTTANLPAQTVRFMERWHFCVVTEALYGVETFFVVGGISSVYCFLRLLNSVNGKLHCKTILMYFFSRYWRLTPMYVLYMITIIGLYQYMGDGPLWPETIPQFENCKTNWWAHILYINNFVYTDNQCLPHTWYLAVDIQLFVVASLVLILFYIKPILAYVLISVLMGTHLTCTAVLYKDWLEQHPDHEFSSYFNNFFIKPYNRVGHYMVGVITGYIMYETEGTIPFKTELKRTLFAIAGWCISLTVLFGLVFGIYDERRPGGKPLTSELSTLYESCRIFWSIGVAWIIYACSAGYGGFIGAVLKWSGWSVVSRLSLSAFLVHPTFLFRFMYSRIAPLYITEYVMFYIYLGNLAGSYVIGFVMTALFETPCTGLKDVLFARFIYKSDTKPSIPAVPPVSTARRPSGRSRDLSFMVMRQMSTYSGQSNQSAYQRATRHRKSTTSNERMIMATMSSNQSASNLSTHSGQSNQSANQRLTRHRKSTTSNQSASNVSQATLHTITEVVPSPTLAEQNPIELVVITDTIPPRKLSRGHSLDPTRL